MDRARGFSLVEMLIVTVAGIVLLGVGVAVGLSFLRAADERKQVAALAQDMGRLAEGAQAYVRERPSDYPVGTRKSVPIADLIQAGQLPAAFADRAGDGIARSPLGQPYAVVALRRADDKPVTVVVYEQDLPLPEKLAALGLESSASTILRLKEAAAGRLQGEYQRNAGTLLDSRTATGPGANYTLDLAAYFDQAPASPTLVALVNFTELEAGNEGTGQPVMVSGPKIKQWQSCQYKRATIGKDQPVDWVNLGGCGPAGPDLCPDGRGTHWEASPVVVDCRSKAAMSMTPTGVVMAHGWVDTITNREEQGQMFETLYRYGSITLDNVTMVQSYCAEERRVHGIVVYSHENPKHQALGVCCSYTWDRPEPTCPPPPTP